MEKSKERYVAEAMINEYLKMKKGECLAITADQDSNFPQLEAYLDVCHENEIACTILKTATPPGQSKAAEVTVPADATREFLMNVDCWTQAQWAFFMETFMSMSWKTTRRCVIC